MTVRHYTVTIPDELQGQRIDKALHGLLPDWSRTLLQAHVAAGQVLLDGTPCLTTSIKVKAGQQVQLTLQPPQPITAQPQEIPLTILFEDAHLIVVDKPPAMAMHPAAGCHDGTLVNALLAHCGASLSGIGGQVRPGIVHRLDKDTSGVVVVAKTDAVHQHLSQQFADRTNKRAYYAIVKGRPQPASGCITGNIGRHPQARKKMTVLPRGGRYAETHYQTLAHVEGYSLLQCVLKTGRTHQIRVHLSHKGWPIVGDGVYGRAGGIAFGRQALHAWLLGFIHPATQVYCEFAAPLPADMAGLCADLGLTSPHVHLSDSGG